MSSLNSPQSHPDQWQHIHVFDEGNPLAERNVRWATLLTAIMMVVEILGGVVFNSMALLADGLHMSSHTLALGLAVVAYAAARRFARDHRFAFGTWKIEILGGFTSALFLVVVAFLMIYHSVERLISPVEIHYNQAISLAIVGLFVNLACAWLLKGGDHHHHGHDHSHVHKHSHSHEHDHDHDHTHETEQSTKTHKDLNLHSAYVHVLVDAMTSVLAIIALTGGKFLGANWLDPVIGIVGGIVVLMWAYGLVRDTARILLDAEMDAPIVAEIRDSVEKASIKAQITDLHVWRVGREKYAVILSLITTDTAAPDDFKKLLLQHEELAHVTVEVNHGSA